MNAIHEHTREAPPPPPTTTLRRALDGQLSPRGRLGYVALLLAASAMTAVVLSLWTTEPVVRPRLHAAFAALTLIGAAWTAFAAWVLTHRQPLLAWHRVLAGRLAVTFTSVFAASAAVAIVMGGGRAAMSAAALGLVMLAVAVVALVRARREHARLVRLRDSLSRERDAMRS